MSATLLDAICKAYGTGDPDPREPGAYLKVFWKQFAFDFDNWICKNRISHHRILKSDKRKSFGTDNFTGMVFVHRYEAIRDPTEFRKVISLTWRTSMRG